MFCNIFFEHFKIRFSSDMIFGFQATIGMWSDRINLTQQSLKIEVNKQSSLFWMDSVIICQIPGSTNSLFDHRRPKHVVNSAVIAIRIGLRRVIIRPNCMQVILKLTLSEHKINAYLILTVSFIGIKEEDDFMTFLCSSWMNLTILRTNWVRTFGVVTPDARSSAYHWS